MKKILLFTTVLALSFTSCETTQTTTNPPVGTPMVNSLTNTYWKLVELNGSALPATTVGDRNEIFMVLSSAGNKVVGNGGCNSFSGSFVSNSNGATLNFSQLVRTKMACGALQLEDGLFKVLETTDSYTLVNNELHLTKNMGTPMAKFISIAGKTGYGL